MKRNRILDYLLTVPAVILLAPVFLVISLWIKIDSPGPVFFKQKRVGLHKNYFSILKFRTMRCDTPGDVPTHLLKNPEQYITKSGAFLRKTSLDELPQLLNIIKGDMSVVGPRPALWNQYDLIALRDQYGANDVLPGLTGWAQIHGRDTITIEEKAKLDGYYVEHQSVKMYVKCIFLTIASVLKQEDVVEGGTGVLQKNTASVPVNPKVSVIIATYRREQQLEEAIDSILRQTYKNLEIIVVDDNGDPEWNDKVAKVIEKKQKAQVIPILYLKNETNLGSAKNRNKGIRAATGEYVTFLDDDDVYKPYKVQQQVKHMIKKQSDFSITDLELYNEKGELVEKRTRKYLYHVELHDKERVLAMHLIHHLTGTDTLMFRRTYLLDIGCFPPIDMGDEFYLMKEAIVHGGVFSYLPVCDVKALVHSKTMGMSSSTKKVQGENTLYQYKKQFFKQLKCNEVRYIRMRHHLVLAYAYLRDRKYLNFVAEGILSVISAPVACIRLVMGIKNDKEKN